MKKSILVEGTLCVLRVGSETWSGKVVSSESVPGEKVVIRIELVFPPVVVPSPGPTSDEQTLFGDGK
ncbi:MAG TPA: hypothetical protein VJB99_01770 [Patescibacteria group bacterium]|nr:hypothetical protein [Patescibacteria group bacterium]